MASVFTRRVLAYVIDFFVVSAFMWIVSYLLSLIINPYGSFQIYTYFPYVVPVLGLLYFVVLEKSKGSTVGKALMYLRVISRNGRRISWIQSIVRNLTKIFWFPVIFDWAIGKILKRSDRIFGIFTKTIVVNEIE